MECGAEIVGTGRLPLTVNPTHRFALIIVCEAFARRSVSLARMSIGTLRCAGIVALAGFKSVWRSDRRGAVAEVVGIRLA